MKDLVGFYQSREQAEQVQRALLEAGYERDDITLYDRSGKDEASLWEDIKSAFGSGDEEDRHLYAEATRRGAVAVGLSLDDDDAPPAQRATQIMQQYNPIDLDQQAAQWRQQGWAGYERAATAQMAGKGKEVVPVIEEELKVGKRQVERGGIRVHTRVSETPVQEQVQLREERATVERRPANRPVTDADRAFQERAVEVTERSEQAVVQKQARVVEEVVVGKDVQQRTETVRDTVRRTDVDVEQVGGGTAFAADSFAEELARDQRFRGKDWKTVEPDARRTFEQRYPGNKWEQFKDSVYRGYEKLRQKA